MSKYKPYLFACAALLCAGKAWGVPQTDLRLAWIARYNGPGTVTLSDGATGVATDASGNAYVTGSSEGAGVVRITTVKYDPLGNQLWVARYLSPTTQASRAYDLALDADGNVYVTGISFVAGGNQDYVTLKYDTNGNQQWAANYNGPGNREDTARSVAADAWGNVYVTGSAYMGHAGTIARFASVTVKYDAGGNQVWVRRYNGSGNGASALALDRAGNVYVTGPDGTLKYDPNGNPVWTAFSNVIASALTLDPQGNVYVTGTWIESSLSDQDYITVKYNADGALQWRARYNGPSNGPDGASSIALDASGNVYVTGGSRGPRVTGVSPTSDYATIKYAPDGAELWVRRYNGPGNSSDGAGALVVGPSGNVIVTGTSFGGTSTQTNYTTLMYDTDGAFLWGSQYNGPGRSPNNYDGASGLALDVFGNLFVTGSSQALDGGFDYVTIKYTPGARLPLGKDPTGVN